MYKTDFGDIPHWKELEAKHLSRYHLPKWDKAPNIELMTLWLERMGWKEKDYIRHQATTLSEWIELNPTWPLRAWIGETLELIDEN